MISSIPRGAGWVTGHNPFPSQPHSGTGRALPKAWIWGETKVTHRKPREKFFYLFQSLSNRAGQQNIQETARSQHSDSMKTNTKCDELQAGKNSNNLLLLISRHLSLLLNLSQGPKFTFVQLVSQKTVLLTFILVVQTAQLGSCKCCCAPL